MNPANELARDVLATAWFAEVLRAVTIRGVHDDLRSIRLDSPLPEVQWNSALRGASALTSATTEAAQNAVLRIAQGCLSDPAASEPQRAAAAVLLERLGNHPALSLAADRHLVRLDAWTDAPAPLQLDVVRRRLELGIPVAGGSTILGNPFQRQFWTAANDSRWLSVSAPTSAGKSFIVKRWFDERLATATAFRGVYLVPTRALIDEVSADLNVHLNESVPVFTIPWDEAIGTQAFEIHVVTQERLHLLQQRLPTFAADLLFIDEAQKFADGARGVLLQRVLDESVRRNGEVQVVFASPLAENPDILLDGAPAGSVSGSLISETVTVNQNVLWVDEGGPDTKTWQVDLVSDELRQPVGTIGLTARPTNQRKRLSLVAAAIGGADTGNLVYVNGAADAEKVARDIASTLAGAVDLSEIEAVQNLADLIRRTVHPQYALLDTITRGVGFHYGNMPLLIRGQIEQLFRDGVLRYLVCTSTLLEGVNLPCRNLFARGPQRGRNRPMTPADFWNLAGRAGRWGKEFQGNIVCIDATDASRWPSPPRKRIRQPLSRATDAVVQDIRELKAYIDDGTPLEIARKQPVLEAVFSFIAARQTDGTPVSRLPGFQGLSASDSEALQSSVATALSKVEVPESVFRRHPGISPLSMQDLLAYFRTRDAEALLLRAPESTQAAESYVRALGRCSNHLGAPFGRGGRTYVLAILITEWMRGYALARLISKRIAHFAKTEDPPKVPKHIRETMADVEEYARFQAPKYLGCYADVLAFHLGQIGREDLASAQPDVVKLLELGVSSDTETSLMTLGLSRTSAVEVAQTVVPDDLSRDGALQWLAGSDLYQLELPVLVRQEVEAVLRRATPPGGPADK
jgi:hypothetical protein